MLHLVNWYHARNDNERERIKRASETWDALEDRGIHTETISYLPRTGQTVFGEGEKAVPFLMDILNWGSQRVGDETLLIVTNADSCMVLDSAEILETVATVGWCFRYDFERPVRNLLTRHQMISKGRKFHGADCFVIRSGIWKEVRKFWPDMVMGFGGWDSIMRQLMDGVGNGAEIPGIVYHETHGIPYWMHVQKESMCGCYNAALALNWIRALHERFRSSDYGGDVGGGIIVRDLYRDVLCYGDYENLEKEGVLQKVYDKFHSVKYREDLNWAQNLMGLHVPGEILEMRSGNEIGK